MGLVHPAKSWDLKRVGWSWHSERFTLCLSMRLSPQSFAVRKTSVWHQLGLSCSSPRHPPACSGPSTGVPSPLPSSIAFPAASGTQSLFAVVFHLQTKKDVLRFVIKQELFNISLFAKALEWFKSSFLNKAIKNEESTNILLIRTISFLSLQS